VAELANLQIVVGADVSAAERGLDTLGSKVSSTGSAITAALGGAMIGATVALGAAFVASAKSAADFEKQMSAVSAVSGASASDMEALTKSALQLGKDTSFSATEAAQGIEELVKAGVSVADVMGGGARAALDLAAAGAVSVADAAEIASNAMNVFGLKGAEMGHVADVIAGAANASAISVTDYKFSLSAAGAVAAAVGINFESLSQAIAVMGSAGIKGSDAGTSLKTMMLNLQPSTKAQWKEFQKLGIVTADGANAFFTAEGKAKSFAEIAEVLKTSMAGMTKQQQLASLEILFGSDAIRAGAVLLEAGAEGFDKMAEAMGKVTAQQVAEERLNNLWGSVEKLKGSLETAAIMLGGLFTPALKKMADVANVYVGQAIEIIEQLPDAWRTVGEAFAGAWEPSATLTPFMNMVGMVGIAMSQLYTTVKPVLDQLGIAWEIAGRFVDGYVIIVQQALTGDLPAAFQNYILLLVNIGAEVAELLTAWGQAFVDWVAPMIPPLLEALGGMLSEMVTWLGSQVATIAQALYQWFTDTIAAIDWAGLATSTGTLLGTMVGEAIVSLAQSGPIITEWLTTITATLAAVDWKTIGTTTGELMVTMTVAAIGLIVGAAMVLAAWTNAFVATIKAITWEDVKTTLSALLVGVITAVLGLAEILNAFTTGFATAIVQGITGMSPSEAIAALGKWLQDVVTKAVGGIQWPSWMGGGGGAGMTSLSNRTGGGSSGNAVWDKIAREEGVDPALLASLIQQESNGNQGARSPAGAIGLTQLMPGTAASLGVNPHDPEQNVRGGARYLRQMIDKFGDEERALIAYNAGPGGGIPGESKAYAQRVLAGRVAVPNAGMGDIRISQAQWGATAGMTPQEAAAACGPYAAYLFAQATGRTPNPAEAEQLARAAGWTEAGMGGTDNFMRLLGMQGVNAVRMGTSGMSAADITTMAANAGPMTGFSTPGHYFASTGFDPSSGRFNVGATGTFAGGETWMTVAEMAALMGPIQDIITLGGQMGAAFTTGGKQVTDGVGLMGPATTAASGEVVSAFGTMATGVAGQTQATLTSVTNLGGAMMTTTHDAAGSVITTIADMSGNVTSQYATLANGVSLTMGDMAAGVLTSTTDLGGAIMTTVQDMSGNYITTITDMSGNVTSQYTTLGAAVTAETATMSAGVTAEVATMSQETLTSVTDMGTGTLTITQNAAGEMIATITDMAGNVTSQYQTMGSDVQGTVEEMGSAVVESLGEVESGFTESVKPIEGFQEALDSVEPPDFGDIVDELNDVRKAAEKAAEAIEEVGDGGGGDDGDSKRDKWWDDERAAGGPVSRGKTYLVGERGPELFSPFSSGNIIPNHRISSGGGGDTYVVSVNVSGSLLANRRDIEEAVIVGLESAQRRGRL
jgi:TP901 family phage tail tape measure protein